MVRVGIKIWLLLSNNTAPKNLPLELLSDRTYRYYRSTAGRASPEDEALQMCEHYRHYHPQSSEIYYDDPELRIHNVR